MAELSKEIELLRDVAESSHVIGVIGERGLGKSWLATLLKEIARLAGDWHGITWDTKGDDPLLDTPADGWQARRLRALGLEPRGWRVKFYTFNFPYGLRDTPLKYELAPIALRMIGFGHLRMLSSVLSPADQRLLVDAYFDAGGPEATLADVIRKVLLKKGSKVSRTLLALLTSGFFADESPLEPENLLAEAEERDFTVISTAYFESSSVALARFGLLVLLDAIKHYLRATQTTHRLIFTFRELGEVAPRSGAVGGAWHLAQHVVDFVRTARQTGFSVTRLFYEAQSVRDVPTALLANTHVLIIHPANLKQEDQMREVKRHWPIPEELRRRLAPMRVDQPGKFILLRKDGDWAILSNVPPPLSMRIREPRTREEAIREAERCAKLLPRMDLSRPLQEALERMRWWLAQAQDIEDDQLLVDPTIINPSLRLTKGLATLLFALRRVLDGADGVQTVSRRELSSWLYRTVGNTNDARWLSPYLIGKSVERGRPILKAAGIRVGRTRDGDMAFAVDCRKFGAAWERRRDVVLELIPEGLREVEGLA